MGREKRLSPSELKTWCRCPREWMYRYKEGIELPGINWPRDAGKWLHRAFHILRVGGRADDACHTLAQEYPSEPSALFPLAYLLRLVVAYAGRYDDRPAGSELHITGVIDQVPVEGIVDALLSLNETTLILDTKVKLGWLGDAFYGTFRPNLQFQQYVAMVQEILHEPCDSVLVDIVRLDLKKHEVKPERDFIRYGPVAYTPSHMAEHRQTVATVLEEMERADAAGFYRQNPEACGRGSNSLCDFHPLCTAEPEARQALQADLYVPRLRRVDANIAAGVGRPDAQPAGAVHPVVSGLT